MSFFKKKKQQQQIPPGQYKIIMTNLIALPKKNYQPDLDLNKKYLKANYGRGKEGGRREGEKFTENLN